MLFLPFVYFFSFTTILVNKCNVPMLTSSKLAEMITADASKVGFIVAM